MTPRAYLLSEMCMSKLHAKYSATRRDKNSWAIIVFTSGEIHLYVYRASLARGKVN